MVTSLASSLKTSSPYSKNSFRLFALVIGVNVHGPPPHKKPLKCAVSDAQLFVKWLGWRGVPTENIVLLTDQNATSSAIINALKRMKSDKRIRRGDPIVIYYAGHGTEIPAPNGWECGRADNMIQAIVPYDCDTVKSDVRIAPIADRILGALIGSIAREKDNNIAVIFDCCHSASGTRGSSDIDSEDIPRSVELLNDYSKSLERQLRSTGLNNNNLTSTHDINFAHSSMESHVLLAACGQHEKAYEGSTGGKFTAALLQVLYNEPLEKLRYSDIIGLMKPFTKQKPHCEGLYANRILFTPKIPIAPRQSISVVYKGGTGGQPGQYTLSAGKMQQVKPQCQFALFDQFDFTKQLGILTVTRSKDIGEISSMATFTPNGHTKLNSALKYAAIQVKYGKEGKFKESDLKVFIPRFDKPPLRGLNLDGVYSVNKLDNADIGILLTREHISFKIRLRSADQRLTHPPWTKKFPVAVYSKSQDVQRVLSKAIHFFRGLNFNSSDSIISKNVTMKFCEVLDHGTNSPKAGCNLFKDGIVSIPYKKGAYYGIELDNKTELNLYVGVFIFDVSELSIRPVYTEWQDVFYEHDYSLPAGQKFPIGWGSTGRAHSLHIDELAENQSKDIYYLKMYISTQPVNLTYMCQESPFAAVSRSAETPTQSRPTVTTGCQWAVISMPVVVYQA